MLSGLGYVLLFLGFSCMTSLPRQKADIVEQNLLGF